MVGTRTKEQQRQQQRRSLSPSLSFSEAVEPVRSTRARGGGRAAFPSSSSSSSDGDERCQHPTPQQEVEARRRGQGLRRRRGRLEDAADGGSGGARRSGGGGRGGSSGGNGRRRRRGSFLPTTASASFQRPRLPLARGREPAQRDHGDARQGQLHKVRGSEVEAARREGAGVGKGPSSRPRCPRGLRRGGLRRDAEPLEGLAGFLDKGGQEARGEVEGAIGEGAEARAEKRERRGRRRGRLRGRNGVSVSRCRRRHLRLCRRGRRQHRCLRGAYRPSFACRFRRQRIELSSVSFRRVPSLRFVWDESMRRG